MKRPDHYWYSKNLIARSLLPLSWLFRLCVALRRWAYGRGMLRTYRTRLPVIVVGNITVGGSGKTPLVIWLAQWLTSAGFRPGIVSRGYGGMASTIPRRVNFDSNPAQVGDEAVMLARRTHSPIAVAQNRVAAVEALAAECDVIISDDGLQHYALARIIEIAVIDGQRRFGNGWCLPAGPLRESVGRLSGVDFVVANGIARVGEFLMSLAGRYVHNVGDETLVRDIEEFSGVTVHAVAGIGNPRRFFLYLKSLGLRIIEHEFPDHHPFTADDLEFNDGAPVLMTEKDAVKCRYFNKPHHWYLPVEAHLNEAFGARLLVLLQRRMYGQETA